jgi:hypothetical protein
MTNNQICKRSGTLVADVILGCNPNPVPGTSGWSERTGRVFDVFDEDYGPGDWSLSCHDGVVSNSRRVVGPGTVGWVHRSDGAWGHLAGVIVFNGDPRLEADDEVYCDGVMFRFPVEWWIPGEDINTAGWSNRAPWGDTTPRRYRNGEELKTADAAVLQRLLHPVALDWVNTNRQMFAT